MAFLRTYRGALLVISHDLDLLDQAITRVLHLDEGELIEYRGTYSQYLVARKADEERRAKIATRQESEIRRLSTLADSMRAPDREAGAGRQDARPPRRQAEREPHRARPRVSGRCAVKLPDPPHAGRVALEVVDLAKAFGPNVVFDDVSFEVGRGERLLVLGLNGAGKTTLLRSLVGELEPDLGEVQPRPRRVDGLLRAGARGHHAGAARDRAHPRSASGEGEQYLRGLLGMFGLRGELAFQDAGTLSGGEKTKLALAMLVAGRHNLLLLDEPTNNLDPPSRAAIGNALRELEGRDGAGEPRPRVRQPSSRPNRVLLMPDGSLDYWSDDLLDLVELA